MVAVYDIISKQFNKWETYYRLTLFLVIKEVF